MKEFFYIAMTWSPAIMTAYGPFITLLMMGYRLKEMKHWVATYAFHNMIERKADCFGEKRWMFKDVDLETWRRSCPEFYRAYSTPGAVRWRCATVLLAAASRDELPVRSRQ